MFKDILKYNIFSKGQHINREFFTLCTGREKLHCKYTKAFSIFQISRGRVSQTISTLCDLSPFSYILSVPCATKSTVSFIRSLNMLIIINYIKCSKIVKKKRIIHWFIHICIIHFFKKKSYFSFSFQTITYESLISLLKSLSLKITTETKPSNKRELKTINNK